MAHERPRFKSLLAASALGLVCACAQQEAERTPAAEAPTLGTLENVYDRTKWEWVKNPDSRMLLKHRQLAQCFLDPNPPMDFAEPGLRVTRGAKTIGTARYDVVTAYEKQDFWEAVYLRSGSARPMLGVFAGGRCQEEAEKILETFENRAASAGTPSASRGNRRSE
jgi:hypothetical protein